MTHRIARGATLLAALLLVGLLWPAVLAAEIEGVYDLEREGTVTVRIAKGGEAVEFVGVVVDASSDWHRKQIGQAVLELKETGPGAYAGRYNAYHLHLSPDASQWHEIIGAKLLDNGDLRCQMKAGRHNVVLQVVYKRARGPTDGGIVGYWKDTRTGRVTYVLRHRDSFLEQIVKPSWTDERLGFRVGEETCRLKQAGPGTYKGKCKVKGHGRRRSWWEDIEVTVRGHSLKTVRTGKEGQRVTGSAVRLGSGGTALGPDEGPASERDPTELAGQWRDTDGGVTRYTRRAGLYRGQTVVVSPLNRSYGFRVGEEGVRVRRTGPGIYKGQVLVKSYGGRAQWWEDILITVQGDSLKFTRVGRKGGLVKGSAVRMKGR